jgi:hypothetical protein
MSPYLELALATLEDLRDDLHTRGNKAFFDSRFVTAVDFGQQESTVRNCLALLRTLAAAHPLPAEDLERVAG